MFSDVMHTTARRNILHNIFPLLHNVNVSYVITENRRLSLFAQTPLRHHTAPEVTTLASLRLPSVYSNMVISCAGAEKRDNL